MLIPYRPTGTPPRIQTWLAWKYGVTPASQTTDASVQRDKEFLAELGKLRALRESLRG